MKPLSEAEYKALKEKDLADAQALIDEIQNSTSKYVIYKDGKRPVTDLKHMIESSAQLFPDNVAFYQKFNRKEPYTAITYTEMLERVNALGTAFINVGLKDKRIGVVGPNCSQWAISYLATVCGTGVVVPLDKELNAKELKQLAQRSEISAIVCAKKYVADFQEMIASGDTKLELIINMDAHEDDGDVLSWWKLVETGKELVAGGDRRFLDAQVNKDEMSILLFTSGTTGVAKGVMLSQFNIIANIITAPTAFKVDDTDVFFSVLPIHHVYECTCGFLLPLNYGASIAYCEGLKHITNNLAEVKPTIFLGVPLLFETLYSKIWKNVRKQGKEKLLKNVLKVNKVTKKVGLDLGNIFLKDIRAVFGGRMRCCICGGAAINPEILDGIRAWGINALQGYGLTECAPMGALNPENHPKSDAIGVPFPGADIRIDSPDEDGIGEICLAGKNIMLGYYQMPEETAEVIKDGWYYTGDLGYIDEDGYTHITGRKKNVIITKNGKNVFPEELEYYLSTIPFVQESFVFGQESSDGQDTIIVASIKMDEEELEEILGKDYEPEAAKKLLEEAVDKINADSPMFKKIRKIIIRKTDFVKNASKKLIRFAPENKEEQ